MSDSVLCSILSDGEWRGEEGLLSKRRKSKRVKERVRESERESERESVCERES